MIGNRLSRTVSRGQKVLILVATCGCGGASNDGTQVSIPTGPLETLALAERLASEIAPLNISNSNTVQSLGSVTFQGTVSGTISTDANTDTYLTGLLSVEANLSDASSNFSGQATDFVTNESVEVPGLLVLEEAVFSPDTNAILDYSFSSILEGELSLPDRGESGFSIKLEGDFFGPDASYVGGGAFGVGITQGRSAPFRGRFVATTNDD